MGFFKGSIIKSFYDGITRFVRIAGPHSSTPVWGMFWGIL